MRLSRFIRSFFLLPLAAIALPLTAFAGGFETANAKVVIGDAECKKAYVHVADGRIEVDCKAGGYIRRVSELRDLRWTRSGKWASLMANEVDGSVFTVTVPKAEFAVLKETMLAMMADGEPEAPPVVVKEPAALTTVITTTTTAAPASK